MRSLGFWGPLFAIFLMVLHSVVFVPSEIILFANIYIYGFALGLLYTWIGSMLGAYLSFYLARLFGKPLVENLFP
ncbi:VTT domain-containing protein [Guptibacillus hwajinpoensis]|uniref:VTT domain-containing protein n=1 Tax=Guptibacillus hwajinpoensis TaxID=208199 RepID=UPI0038D3DA04